MVCGEACGMARKRWLSIGLAGLALAVPALAKETEPAPAAKAPTVSGVTVDAPKKENPLVDPTTQFVRQHLPQAAFSDQLARFRDDVCVKVIGLPPEFDAFVAKRIVELARQVKAPVAPAADCTPNVHVIFSPRPQAQIDDIAKRKDILIGFHFPSQLQRMTTFSRPIQSWYVTRVRDTYGASQLEVDTTCPWDPRVPGCGDRPMGKPGSRLGNDMSAEVIHTLVIADASKVAGERIETVADYVAVLALARWQGLEKCNGIPTILNRMADGCDDPPDAATPQDLALLKGLYSVQARESGFQQRATIASAIRKASAAEASR
jgi:hypothetical protein